MTTEIKKIIGTPKAEERSGSIFVHRWVRDRVSRLWFSSFPGTLNLKISPEDADFIRRWLCQGTRVIPPPEWLL